MAMRKRLALLVSAVSLLLPLAAQGEVNVNVNIGPPPVVLAAPPSLVVIPGSAVSYAPSVSMNFFAYGGRYFSLHNGAWFVASTHQGPWAVIAINHVPQPVLTVPVTYYKQVPPGHAKKAGHGKGCPPGLAMQGRC